MLQIENDGQEIIKTNFWQTEQARSGGFFLSINAGACRLLVPYQHKNVIKEFEVAKEVILTRGPWPDAGEETAIEILFDDGSDDPYSIHLGQSQVDRWPPAQESGRTVQFSAWILKDGKPFCAYRSEAYFRTAARLPYLKPRDGEHFPSEL